ncbi:hypothetical protein GCM10010129_02940 [Streptomyces fumigatiscleroticus]|nr:hypothetical protein GCM10010129_02940 [Streptomyces fumigatiscleroticus]
MDLAGDLTGDPDDTAAEKNPNRHACAPDPGAPARHGPLSNLSQGSASGGPVELLRATARGVADPCTGCPWEVGKGRTAQAGGTPSAPSCARSRYAGADAAPSRAYSHCRRAALARRETAARGASSSKPW